MPSKVVTLPITVSKISDYFYDKYGFYPETAHPLIRGGVSVRVDLDHPTSPFSKYIRQRLGAPSAASPSRTAIQAPPAAFERVGGRPSSAHGFRSGKAPTARGKCPKGHYWSYKLKKCVRSKY